MKSHDLARLLLTLPDMPIATHAMGHTYMSEYHNRSHGELNVARMKFRTVTGDISHVVIGDMGRCESVGSNEYIDKVYHGSIDRHWPIPPSCECGSYVFPKDRLTPDGWVKT